MGASHPLGAHVVVHYGSYGPKIEIWSAHEEACCGARDHETWSARAEAHCDCCG